MGIFASAVMFSALCQILLVTCEVSGGSKAVCIHGSVNCLVAIVTVQGCHLPSMIDEEDDEDADPDRKSE